MKKPILIKRCKNQHNNWPSTGKTKGMADCEICGDCLRAYHDELQKYLKLQLSINQK